MEDPWSREQRGLEHYPALWQCPHERKVVRSVGCEGSSPKSSSMLNLTCFFTGSLGGHSSIGSFGGGGCPLVCMGVPPLHVLLLDSGGQGCR